MNYKPSGTDISSRLWLAQRRDAGTGPTSRSLRLTSGVMSLREGTAPSAGAKHGGRGHLAKAASLSPSSTSHSDVRLSFVSVEAPRASLRRV